MTEKKSDKVQLTIRLEPETKEKLNLICSVKDISINEYINNLIETKVSEIEPATLTEIAKLKDLWKFEIFVSVNPMPTNAIF